jgi:hypothetical protein
MRPEMMQTSKNVPPAAIPAIAGMLKMECEEAEEVSAVDPRPVEVEVAECERVADGDPEAVTIGPAKESVVEYPSDAQILL